MDRYLPIRLLLLTLSLVLVTACSGGSGGGGSSDDSGGGGGSSESVSFVYSGPAPADQEVQDFKIEFYDKLVANDRCGSCHSAGGAGGLAFVDKGDVNNAWRQAKGVIDENDPGASEIVSKVASGHQCWEGSDAALSCAQLLETYIERWLAGNQSGTTEIVLSPRTGRDLAPTRRFPDSVNDVPAFTADGGLHDLLTTWCADCHSDTAAVRQSPFFASEDVNLAYESVMTKIDLITPENSRLLVRIRDEGHNCFGECDEDSVTLLAAIRDVVNDVPVVQVDPTLLTSPGQILDVDGIAVSAGGRYEDNIIARWEFGEGGGNTAVDNSGVGDILLNVSGEFEWLGIGGIRFMGGKAQATIEDSQFIRDNLTATGEYSLEFWITPFNVVQDDANIVSYAGGSSIRNFNVSQSLYNYIFYNRSVAPGIDGAGSPGLTTDDADEVAQAALQHVVATFSPVEGRKLYVNGVLVTEEDAQGGAGLSNWNDSFALVLGNDPSGNNPWRGNLRYLAIHNRILDQDKVTQNFSVGIGQDYFMLFSVSSIIDEPGVCHDGVGASRVDYCYVAFEVSQLDSYSYLFENPFFITLNDEAFPQDFSIKGIRIGINGKLAPVGQAFVNVDADINAAGYNPEGQLLADIGSIVSMEISPAEDLFFLAFEEIAGQQGVTTANAVYSFDYNLGDAEDVAIGMRGFDEINSAFSAVTTVPTATVRSTYEAVQRSLPAVNDFQAYFASHQMAVTQLAIAYCDALVEDPVKRASYFSDGAAFNFSQPADSVSDNEWRDRVLDPLLQQTLIFAAGDTLELSHTQPVKNTAVAELMTLITDTNDNKPYQLVDGDYQPLGDNLEDGLARCDQPGESDTPCSVQRTAEVVKAVCAVVLANAAVGIK